MKRFFKRFRFRKADEMERHILFQSQRNSYLFLVIALTAWTLCESGRVYLHHTRLNLLPCLLLMGALLVQTFSQLFLTRQAVKDDEDSYETEPLAGLVVLICVLAALLAAAAGAFVLLCVKL